MIQNTFLWSLAFRINQVLLYVKKHSGRSLFQELTITNRGYIHLWILFSGKTGDCDMFSLI
jgi:hypothetical protein